MRLLLHRIFAFTLLAAVIPANLVSAGDGSQMPPKPDWAAFKTELLRYRDAVNAIKQSAAQAGTDNLVKTYLLACSDIADSCLTALAEGTGRVMDLPALESAIQQRNTQQDIVMDNLLMSNPWVRQEIKAYTDIVFPYMNERYLGLIRARNVLWEEKYFPDWGKQGNFFEVWLNSHVPWTSFSAETAAMPPTFGVSPWEFTVRAEPIILLEGNYEAAALLAAGCLYTFFPQVELKESGEVRIERDFFNQTLAKVGPRLGLGTTINSPRDVFISGGVQIRAWTVWYTYNTHGSHWSFAIGLSDWTWIKQFLPYFGMLP